MARSNRGSLRLIGGRFGGRRLPIPVQPGLRPSSDRLRETLFNWLAPTITGSRVLDAFAGTGALGFEALSRDAARVVMLERNPIVVAQLRANAERLGTANLDIVRTDALRWLEATRSEPFDLVFLDPPFADRLLPATLTRLGAGAWLVPGGRIYVETEARAPLPDLPSGWEWLREKTAAQVRFGLALAGPA